MSRRGRRGLVLPGGFLPRFRRPCRFDAQLHGLADARRDEVSFGAFPQQFQGGLVHVIDQAAEDDGCLRQFSPQTPDGVPHVCRRAGIEVDQADNRNARCIQAEDVRR